MRRWGDPFTWLLIAVVVALAASAVLSRPGSRLPGVVRLAVLEGPGKGATERALQPLGDYLSYPLRRAVAVEALGAEDFLRRADEFDLALLPPSLAECWEGARVVAFAKHRDFPGARARPFALRAEETRLSEAARVILGDAYAWSSGASLSGWLREAEVDAPLELCARGVDPYDHVEAIAALVHGAFDLAVVRETDLRRALDSGLVDRRRFRYEPIGAAVPGFALVAGPRFADRARRSVREAALNLDHYRYDRSQQRVRAVLAAMGQLGLAGFVPVEPLPALRP